MGRGSCTFRQRDVRAAVAAVRAAGVPVSAVHIMPDGTIVIRTESDTRPATRAETPERPEIIL